MRLALTVVNSMPAALRPPLSVKVDPWNASACPPRLPLSVTTMRLTPANGPLPAPVNAVPLRFMVPTPLVMTTLSAAAE